MEFAVGRGDSGVGSGSDFQRGFLVEPSSTPDTEVVVAFSLPLEEGRKLFARATEMGKDVPSYLRELVEEDLKSLPTWRDEFAPIHEDFARSGMTEDELASLIEETREEVWEEKQRGRRHP